VAVLNAIEDFLGLDRYFSPKTFDKRVYNASGRRNFKPLTYLGSLEGVVEFFEKTVSPRLLIAVRRLVDRLATARRPAGSETKDRTPENLEAARTALSQDIIYVRELFATGGLLRGSGASWPAPSSRGPEEHSAK